MKPEYNHESTRGIWYFGEAGTGKSRKAYDENPGAFRKSQNKWWDSYSGEAVVILDDLDKEGAKYIGHNLKIWTDRYACKGEIKGGTVQL